MRIKSLITLFVISWWISSIGNSELSGILMGSPGWNADIQVAAADVMAPDSSGSADFDDDGDIDIHDYLLFVNAFGHPESTSDSRYDIDGYPGVTIFDVTVLMSQFARPAMTPTPSGDPSPSPHLNDPEIEIMQQSAVPGYDIGVFGSGFGTTPGKVSIAGVDAPILHWRDDFVQLRVPEIAFDGDLYQTTLILTSSNDTSISQPIWLYTIDPAFLAPPNPMLRLSEDATAYYTRESAVQMGEVTMHDPAGTYYTSTQLTNNRDNLYGGRVDFGDQDYVAIDLEQPTNGPMWLHLNGGKKWNARPSTYTITIYASSTSTNGMDGTWQMVKPTSQQARDTSSHQLDVDGQRWIKVVFGDIDVTLGESPVQVKEINVYGTNESRSRNASLIVFGDSNTAEDLRYLGADEYPPSYLRSLANASTEVLFQGAGMSGSKSDKLALTSTSPDSLSLAIQEASGFDYWGLAFGTNDSQLNTQSEILPATYAFEQHTREGIQQLLAAGKVPILARIPDTAESVGGMGSLESKRVILDAIDRLNLEYRLPPGPDLYTLFRSTSSEGFDTNNDGQIDRYGLYRWDGISETGDGTHHTLLGGFAVSELWARAVADLGLQ